MTDLMCVLRTAKSGCAWLILRVLHAAPSGFAQLTQLRAATSAPALPNAFLYDLMQS